MSDADKANPAKANPGDADGVNPDQDVNAQNLPGQRGEHGEVIGRKSVV